MRVVVVTCVAPERETKVEFIVKSRKTSSALGRGRMERHFLKIREAPPTDNRPDRPSTCTIDMLIYHHPGHIMPTLVVRCLHPNTSFCHVNSTVGRELSRF